MGVLADHQIRALVAQFRMIEPFAPELVHQGVLSFGTAGYGYDLRLAGEFQRLDGEGPLDPKDPSSFTPELFQASSCIIEPGETVLGRSLEYFRIPRNILAFVWGKSTYARAGLLVNVTPLEPQWEGFITMALANIGRRPVKIYAKEGIAQVVFVTASHVCRTSYADRKGKYQSQTRVVPPLLSLM